MRHLMAAAATILLLCPTAAVAHRMPCNDRDVVIEHLAREYQEARAAVAVTNRGHLMELFKSENDETWTLVVSQPNNVACIAAHGEGWREVEWVIEKPET